MSGAVDAEMVNAFLGGTINVLKTMCQTVPVSGKASLKTEREPGGDISGAIPLTGDKRGIVVLSFSKEAIITIVSRMLYEEKSEIDAEVKDAVGEITNMIAGDSRKNLEALGMKLEAGIPEIFLNGSGNIYSNISESAKTVAIPLKTDKEESFSVEFTFEQIN
ncbi:MAG: chemotaxis protein CheX [Nitrospinota bacterium]|nr:chemotaxis protein CheX [Nitrospinota bacterium]